MIFFTPLSIILYRLLLSIKKKKKTILIVTNLGTEKKTLSEKMSHVMSINN